MYLFLGGEEAAEGREIVGLFDLDKASQSHITRAFLAGAEQNGRVRNAAEDIPKTFAVLADGSVVLAQPNSSILAKRMENN